MGRSAHTSRITIAIGWGILEGLTSQSFPCLCYPQSFPWLQNHPMVIWRGRTPLHSLSPAFFTLQVRGRSRTHSFPVAFTFAKGRICEFLIGYRLESHHSALEMQHFICSDGSIITRVQNFPSTGCCTSVLQGQCAPRPDSDFSHNHYFPSCNDL